MTRSTRHPSRPTVERPVGAEIDGGRKVRYELIGCGLHGHALVGTDASRLRPEDALFAREDADGLRWHRCMRCDAWLALPPPAPPLFDTPPPRSEIALPLRGRPLRDRYVLRLIAADRLLHVLVLGALTVAIFAFAAHRRSLHAQFTHVLGALQGALGGPVASQHSWLVVESRKLFTLSRTDLDLAGGLLALYTAVLVIEMVGLWSARRWAEYLTLVETGVLVPYEVYELAAHGVSYLKLLTLALNLAVVVYLLLRHRLFGLRGGAAAERAERDRDSGWPALERFTPPADALPGASAGLAVQPTGTD